MRKYTRLSKDRNLLAIVQSTWIQPYKLYEHKIQLRLRIGKEKFFGNLRFKQIALSSQKTRFSYLD